MIPTQLKDCLFCRVLKGTKKPFEKDWTNKPYSYEEISKYFPQENYGVLTGINGLGVLDDDSPDKILMNLFETAFGTSFRVRDHYYIKLKGWKGDKIIFYDVDGTHLGELQGKGQMVVGAGSIHPSGAVYELKQDIPIKEIEFEKFLEVFQKYLKTIKEVSTELKTRTHWEGEDIKDIPISSVISFAGLKDVGNGCYQGSHPSHGSTGGMNFRVDSSNNTWYCFRCGSGGSSPELIAVMEGIIDCSQAGAGCLSGSIGSEVIKVAREKYGLKAPEISPEQQPRGWALSINIKKMAERRNFFACPNCKELFRFNERLGWFKCGCSKGGIKAFVRLYIKNKMILEDFE
jgi:hypothetical protein